MKQQDLMSLPTSQLLDKFGAGKHGPGSGSAAALMGILAGKLIVTVGKLSLRKPQYRENHSRIAYVIDLIEKTIEPTLRQLFEQDAQVFDQVYKLRVARDQATDSKEKRKYREEALEKLKEATDIPIAICEQCLRLLDQGVVMFDIGFKSARGDSGAAISAAVAGAMAGIFVTNLNLRSFRESDWAKERRKRVDELHKELERKQSDAFSRIVTLRTEDVADIQIEIPQATAGADARVDN